MGDRDMLPVGASRAVDSHVNIAIAEAVGQAVSMTIWEVASMAVGGCVFGHD